MKKTVAILILMLTIAGIFSVFSLAPVAYAQEFTAKDPGWRGIVPCGRNSGDNGETQVCTLCHLVLGIQRIIQYGLYIVIAFAFAGIFIAGVMYTISSGNDGMMTQAKGFLSASLIGFAVVLGAWLIVNTTLWIIGAKEVGDKDGALGINVESWSKFSCSGVNAPRISTSTPAQDNPNAINDRKKCLLTCSRTYQVETDPFKGCWELQCPKVEFGSFTSDDACLLDCYRYYSTNNSNMYNCLNLKCPNGSYNKDYKPENTTTNQQCGLNNRGKCYPRDGSVVLGSCPSGLTWLTGGNDCPSGYRCCVKNSNSGEICGPDGLGICKSESTSCVQLGTSNNYPKCASGLKCCKP